MEETLNESANRVARALEGKASYNYLSEVSDTPEKPTSDQVRSALRDLLTDIRHFAAAQGLDIYDVLNGSFEVYEEEVSAG